MIYRLVIPNWHPVRKNQLLSRHPMTRSKLKQIDYNMIAGYCVLNRIPVATGPREVSLLIVLGPGQRGGDVDAYSSSVLDALVNAKMLIDDSRRWARLLPVDFERGVGRATVITLEEL